MKTNRGRSPERTCAACGAKKPKSELMRYVLDGGDICPDERQIRHGRGAYVCKNDKCSEKGTAGKKLFRSLYKTYIRNRKTG